MPKQHSTNTTRPESSPSKEPRWKKFLPACEYWAHQFGANLLADFVFEGHEWASVEHAVHELSHAALLHLSDGLDVTRSISLRIEDKSPTDQITEEKDAWAVEFLVAKELNIPIEENDVIPAASVQGVDEVDMKEALDSNLYNHLVPVVLNLLLEWKERYEAREG